MKKTVIERLSEVAKLIKDKFEDEVEATEVEATESTEEVAAKFEEVSTADGATVLSYDGELAVGTALFIVDAESGEQIPAPEGTYELGGDMTGVSLVVDAEGMVSEIIGEATEGEATEGDVAEVEEAMSSEDVETIVDGKLSGLNDSLNALVSGIESILKENDSLKSEIAEFKQEFAEFKELPSDEKEEKEKFARQEKSNGRMNYFMNKRKNK